MSAKPRVVVDTQVFLRAGLKRQSLVGKIVFDLSDRYQIIFSAETKKEVEDVLNRHESVQIIDVPAFFEIIKPT